MSFPRPEQHEGITIVGTATIQPDKVDEFLANLWTVFEKVTQEPECLSFEVLRFPDQPNKFKRVENWSKGVPWFMQNIAVKPYMKENQAAADQMLIDDRQIEILQRFGGKWAKARDGVYQKR
ncbi:hypothetical protein AURDEDRAFT_56409 [Auricularia subglabra TFB-10046 SS5]|nr:hypothetical protein AURDEDRAFT_56409 [Auricularia subglabra TFB-10046 SS5]